MLFVYSASIAQRNCGTADHFQQLQQKDPSALRNMQKMEDRIQNWIKENGEADRGAGNVITIPVVVHVVWRTNQQNISNAQIQSQIDVLNEDFRKLNADASNIPSAWANTIADSEIEFCLAQRDPNDQPTTGILRVQTTTSSWGTNDNIKFSAQGGSDAWPRDKYLNMWVGNLGGGLLGYAQFPGQQANTDGVVIGYNYFGRVGTVSAPFNKGRTTTHEVGHWLGLFHIWGDDGGSCGGSDNIADTPNQANASSGCPNWPRTDNCTSSSPGIMFMNYMDYTNDACMYSFTNDQRTRMRSVLSTSRSALQNSNGCVPVQQFADDAAIQTIISPTGTACTGTVTPEVVLYNWGTNTLTSVTINWQIDGGATQTQNWTGSLAALASTNVTLPSSSVGAGAHTIDVWTSMPNGNTDQQPSNDQQSGSFTTTSAQAGQPAPFSYNFEPATWPPAGWTVNNPDNDLTWARTGAAGYQSSASTWVNNYDYNANGERDELVMPPIDLTQGQNPVLSWDLSYVLYSQTGFSDTLLVYISEDCGNTWVKIWEKYDAALTTVNPVFQQTPFTPNSDNQWRRETVSLANYTSSNGAILKFVNATDYENNLYIDNVNIDVAVNLDNADLAERISVYPNPNNGQFKLDLRLPTYSDVGVAVYSSVGELVHSEELVGFVSGVRDIDLSGEAAGVYFIRIRTGNATVTRKVSKF